MRKNILGKLFGSIFMVAILCALLVSGTFALFTDTVNIKGNTVQSGNVSIEATLALSDASGMLLGTALADENKVIINNMAPMDKAVYKLTLKSNSSVSIMFRVYAFITDSTLLNAINLKYAYDTVDGDEAVPLQGTNESNSNLIDFGWSTNAMEPQAEKALFISIEMPASVGNEFMEKAFAFDINVYGIQANARDSVTFVNTLDEFKLANTPIVVLQSDIIIDEQIEIRTNANINFDGRTIKAKSIKFIDDTFDGKIMIENGNLIATEGDIELNYPMATGTLQNMSLTVPTDRQAIKGSFSANTLIIGQNVEFITANNAEVAMLEVSSNMTVKVQSNDNTIKIRIPSGSLKIKIVDERIKVDSIEIPQIIVEVGSGTADVEVVNNKETGEDIVVEGEGKFDVTVDEKPLNWIDSADTSWYTDSINEFEISSAKQLAGLSKLVNEGNTFSIDASNGKVIKLTADIDLDGRMWTPIGAKTRSFYGNFDGDNKTISNLNINLPDTNYIGLFGFVNATYGYFKNVRLLNANIIGKEYVGAVIGFNQDTVNEKITAENITVNGAKYVGGLYGQIYGTMKNITAKNIIVNGNQCIGSVAGFVSEGSQYVYDTISADNISVTVLERINYTPKDVGGLFGKIYTAKVLLNINITNAVINNSVDPKNASGIFGTIVAINNNYVLLYENITFQGTVNGEASTLWGISERVVSPTAPDTSYEERVTTLA